MVTIQLTDKSKTMQITNKAVENSYGFTFVDKGGHQKAGKGYEMAVTDRFF